MIDGDFVKIIFNGITDDDEKSSINGITDEEKSSSSVPFTG